MKWFLRIAIALVVFYGAFNYAALHMDGGIWLVILPLLVEACLFAIFFSEIRGFKLHPMTYVGGFIGAILGLIIGSMLSYVLLKLEGGIFLFILINTVFAYLGYTIGLSWGKELSNMPVFRRVGRSDSIKPKILDTSVIIDGRIPDICDAGFIEGVLVAPQFILNELQHIADSSDPLKRARGRRGLDILNRLQKSPNVKIDIIDKDFPKIKEVDSKLIALAKELGADILTNDFNLNKVAQIQGVNVLNINQLANAVKPIVLPGETMSVTITKQGKEKGQGVAYLDDGTMVVVEQGEALMNQSLEVVVTSILQTPAGRMIFAALKNNGS
ncbi:MAG TPA: PIN domain-containing protein [Deltaproteobacteria bacterium]|nr:PIN domain-containing protein [Deltaproteobacteria bacterium]